MAKPQPYFHPDTGRQVPSVTTILRNVKDTESLLHWANKMGRDKNLTLDEARRQPAEAGTVAHKMIEAFIGLRSPTAEQLEEIRTKVPHQHNSDPEVVMQAKNAFDNFIRWYRDFDIEFVRSEVRMVSAAHSVGGRLDAIGRSSDGRLSVIDFKTGKLYPDQLLQVAAYKLLWEEMYPADPLLGGAHILSIKRETGDFTHAHFADLSAEMAAFVRLRVLHNEINAVKRRI